MSERQKTALISLIVLCVLGSFLGFAISHGMTQVNNPTGFPVHGISVSAAQGELSWPSLVNRDIQFAFIMATDGVSGIDPYFAYNFSSVRKTELWFGVYHRFRFDQSGAAQAEHFINTVPHKKRNMLPPVVWLDLSEEEQQNPPDVLRARTELITLLSLLEKHYGMRPTIYTTDRTYSLYVAYSFDGYDIWPHEAFGQPSLSDRRDWIFWQYADQQELQGYDNTLFDMSVFNGSERDFERYRRR